MSNLTISEKRGICDTIYSQLGGNKFKVMTGSKNFGMGDKGELSFSFPNSKSFTHLKIELTSMDDYTMTFFKIRGTNISQTKIIPGIFCDKLQEVFTHETGLFTSL